MKISGIEITNKNLNTGLIVAGSIVVFALYVFIYAPLLKDLRIYSADCKTIELNTSEARHIIESTGGGSQERTLPSEDRVAEAIGELTKKGKSEGVNFISISPEAVESIQNLKYKVLPIKIELESSYKQLGIFLGTLDEFEKGLLRVRSLRIIAEDDTGAKLSTGLVIDMYLSNINEE